MNFEELGLAPNVLKAISRMGFETPTPVQAKVIPRLLKNSGDMVALAQTGTGKTAAFGLPILNMLDHQNRSPQALVLCPTRELCVQITRDMEAFAACSPRVSTLAVYGGTPIQTQLRALSRGVQVIVATPGRMLDILRRNKADLSGVERVILDEADEMLNMGFQEDLEAILAKVPDNAHTLLFSATMPRHVASIARKYMDKPEEITVGQRNAGAENVSHECYVVHQRDRYRALKRIADYYPDMYAIVFCRTRVDTQNVADWLIRDGYNVDSLHGDLSQAQRDRVMDKFRSKGIQILVATDVAARGLDVNDLTHVINYNLPDDLGSYTHRSGRTGRAGKSGISVVIVNMREKGKVQRIERMIRTVFEYRDVPSGREICESQLFSLIERMKAVEVDHKQIDQYLPDIYESLKGMDWKEVVKRFVSLEFNSFLDYYRGAEDLSPGEKWTRSHKKESRKRGSKPVQKEKQHSRSDRAPVTRGVRMVINLGRSDGLNPRKLSELIGRESRNGVKASQIEIKKRCSFFDVPAGEVANLILSPEIADYKGRDVHVAPCDDDQVKRKSFKPAKHRTKSRKLEPGKAKRSGKGAKRRHKARPRPPTGRGKKTKS
jgi:ATP-dependent RNA helicase DeaD